MRFAAFAIVITLLSTRACVSAQEATPATAFEVATIKPAAPFDPRTCCGRFSAGRATYKYSTLKELAAHAYDVKLPQVSGPEWTASEHFDIEAILPEGAAKEDERKMLQALLEERFKLAFHIEKREVEVYALVVGKHGANLKPSPPDPPEPDPDAPLKPGESYAGEGNWKAKVTTNKDGSSTSSMGKRGTQTFKFDSETMTMHWERSKMTMEELVGLLPIYMGTDGFGRYIVVDQTGIKGNYQVAIDYSLPGVPASDTVASDPQGAGALTRSLDALGLKLEKRKAPIDVYVVDHVEKPSEN